MSHLLPIWCFRHRYERTRRQPALHRHAVHELLLVDRGRSTQFTAAGGKPAEAGEIWLFPAGRDHIGDGDGCEAVVLNFHGGSAAGPGPGGSELRSLMGGLERTWRPEAARLPLSRDGAAAARRILLRMEEECRRQLPGWRCSVDAGIHELLALLVRDPGTAPLLAAAVAPAAPGERLAPLLAWMHDHADEPMGLRDLMRRSGLSRSRLHALFRAATGTTPMDHLADLRLARAQALLRTTRREVADIAFSAGFGSLAQFYERFQRAAGMSPGRWRQAAARSAQP